MTLWSPQKWWLLALLLMVAVTTAGLAAFTVKYVSRPRPVEIALSPADAGQPVEVYLGGAVEQEGIYAAGQDATLQDLLQRAGALLSEDEPLRIRVTVLGAGDDASVEPPGQDQAVRVNVNTAGTAELESLPGIGPAKAQAIVDHRHQNGPFRTVDDLLDVPGIGPGTLEDIRDLITVLG